MVSPERDCRNENRQAGDGWQIAPSSSPGRGPFSPLPHSTLRHLAAVDDDDDDDDDDDGLITSLAWIH